MVGYFCPPNYVYMFRCVTRVQTRTQSLNSLIYDPGGADDHQ